MITISRDILFTFGKGGRAFLDITSGKVTLTPRRVHSLQPLTGLPPSVSFDLVEGNATATDMQPTPAPDNMGNIDWAYLVLVENGKGSSWEYLIGLPDAPEPINFSDLPRYFQIPPYRLASQGAQGPQGERGPKGDTGPQGLQGIQGAQGLNGPMGEVGATGAQGLQGLNGAQGEPGVRGIQGLQGAKGEAGAQGTAGLQGEQGLQGIAGAQGAKGDPGAQGLTGQQGVRGVQGDQGVKGDTGLQGIAGTAGTISSVTATSLPAGDPTVTLGGTPTARTVAFGIPAGPQGARGLQGIQGLQGVAGAKGADSPGALVPTAWVTVNLTPTSLNGGAGGTGTFRIRSYGRIRECVWDISGTCTVETGVVTLGSGDRPDAEIVGSQTLEGATSANPIFIRPDGSMRLPAQGAVTRRTGSATFIQGTS